MDDRRSMVMTFASAVSLAGAAGADAAHELVRAAEDQSTIDEDAWLLRNMADYDIVWKG